MKCISGTGLCLACFLYPEITSGYKHGVTAEEGPAPHPAWYLKVGRNLIAVMRVRKKKMTIVPAIRTMKTLSPPRKACQRKKKTLQG